MVSKFCLWDVVMRYYMYSNGKAATLLIIDATALCIWQGSLMHNSQNLFWVYMHTLEAYLMNLCLKAVSMLCCAWLQASKPPLGRKISPRSPVLLGTVFSDDRKRRLLTVDILSGWLLPLAEKSWMFTIRKPKAEKILTGKAKALARIIFFPIPLSILSSVFFFVATFPNAMAKTDDHTAPPIPKDCFSASVDWSIYRRKCFFFFVLAFVR